MTTHSLFPLFSSNTWYISSWDSIVKHSPWISFEHRGGKIRVPCSMHYQFFINEVEDLSTGEKQKVLDVLYSIILYHIS